MPRFSSDRLVLATHNAGKLREFKAILGSSFDSIVTAGDLGLPEPVESGTTFVENALIKARAAAAISKSPVLADDSGLLRHGVGGAIPVFIRRAGLAPTRISPLRCGACMKRSAMPPTIPLISLPCWLWCCPMAAPRFSKAVSMAVIAWPPRGR